MNENETGTPADLLEPTNILAKPFPSPWTPRAVFLVALLPSVMGLGIALVAFLTVTDPPLGRSRAEMVEAVLWLGGISSVCFGVAALCFARALDGYRRGLAQVRPLSYPGQIAAACFLTLVCGSMAVIHILDGQWARLPLFLLNPMLLLTWFGVAHKRAEKIQASSVRGGDRSSLSRGETPTVQAKPNEHWWTRYRTEEQEERQEITKRRS
ncbi:MAG: hypothetical protein V4671_13995 [Armatimonadota bacterium]